MSTQDASVQGGHDAGAAGEADAEAQGDGRDDGDEATVEPEPLSLDVVFEILKNERRRSVLRYLQHHDERVVLGELAEFIAAEENDTSVESLTAQQRKRVYVGLYQCHLPKMDDAGVVSFDRNRGIVELADNADQLAEYLDSDADADHDWPRYYLGLAGGGGLLLAAGMMGMYPAGWITDVVVLGVIAGVACCAVVQNRVQPEE